MSVGTTYGPGADWDHLRGPLRELECAIAKGGA